MIEIEKVTVSFGKLAALEDVCLSVKEGEFWGLFGEDDAGKTTLLHVIMGFCTAYQGTVTVMEREQCIRDAKLCGQIRFVPDDIIWEGEMTAYQYFECAEGASENYDVELQQRLCESFGIPIQDTLLSMTYQENKLVQIIAAVCASPRLLILDEPVNFLSKAAYRSLLLLLRELHKKGMTIIVAAEKYEDVRGFCDHFAYLKEGRLSAAAEVPEPDIRKKVVTVTGLAGEAKTRLEEHMTCCISEYGDRSVYLYEGKGSRLSRILTGTAGEDWLVEELTLEEELDQNYERWE